MKLLRIERTIEIEIEDEIDRIQNSQADKDMVRVETLKDELQKLEDVREEENARRYFAKNNLEGERPTKFFCSLTRN